MSTFAPISALQQIICQHSQLAKVNLADYGLQEISNLIDLAFTAAISKQVKLQGTAWGDHALTVSEPSLDSMHKGRFWEVSNCAATGLSREKAFMLRFLRRF